MHHRRSQAGSLMTEARTLYRESRELAREIQAQERRGAALAGLTATQAHALRAIEEADGESTMLDLARELRIRRSTVTRLVDELEAKRLVRRRPDPRDRRQTRLELLPEGAARLDTHLEAAQQIQIEILLRLSPRSRRVCVDSMAQLRGAVQRWNEDHLSEG